MEKNKASRGVLRTGRRFGGKEKNSLIGQAHSKVSLAPEFSLQHEEVQDSAKVFLRSLLSSTKAEKDQQIYTQTPDYVESLMQSFETTPTAPGSGSGSVPSIVGGHSPFSRFTESSFTGRDNHSTSPLKNNPGFGLYDDEEAYSASSQESQSISDEKYLQFTPMSTVVLEGDKQSSRRGSRRYRKETSTKVRRPIPFSKPLKNQGLSKRRAPHPYDEDSRSSVSNMDSEASGDTLDFPRSFSLGKSHVSTIKHRLAELSNDTSARTSLMGVIYAITVLGRRRRNGERLVGVFKSLMQIVSKVGSHPEDELLFIYCCGCIDNLVGERFLRKDWFALGLDKELARKMRFFRNSEAAQKAACKLFWFLAEDEEYKVRVMKSAVEPIKYAMHYFVDSDSVQYESCALLQRLAVNDENEAIIQKTGALLLVLETAMNPNLDTSTTKKACSALWNLSFNDQNRLALIDNQAHKKLFQIVDHSQSITPHRPIGAEVVAKACGVLWNLADFAGKKQLLIADDVPMQMVQVMRTHRHSARIQEMGAGCLRSLAHDDASRVALMQIGAAAKILEAMKDFLDNQDIQYQSFAVLKKLSCNDVNEGRLIKMEAGERILEAMERHKLVPSISERACGVLWNLAVNDEHKVKLVRIGAANKMLQALKLHPDQEGVAYQCLRTLKRLARDPSNERTLMSLDAASAVLKAMQRHRKNPNIQEKGCGVLWNLSDRDEHKEILMRLGAAQQILQSMDDNLTNDNVQYEACGALKRLAVDDSIEDQLMKMNASDRVLNAMKNHIGNADVQSQACGVLWNLAFNGQLQLMEQAAPKQIFQAMRRHRTVVSVQEKSCGTLWKLAEIERNNQALIDEGVIEEVKEAMLANSGHSGVTYQACGTLWNLAVKDKNREALLHEQVEDCVLAAIRKHASRADIIHSACGVLYNLSQSTVQVARHINAQGVVVSRKAKLNMSRMAALSTPDTFVTKTISINNRVLLGCKGAVEEVVGCIRRHQQSVDVVYQSLAALSYLSREPRNLLRLMRPETLETVLRSCEVHVEDQGVQESALGVLSHVMHQLTTINYDRYLTEITDEDDGEIEDDGIRDLSLSSVKRNMVVKIPSILLTKGIKAVLKIMEQYLLLASVQETGLTYIKCFMLHQRYERRLAANLLQNAQTSTSMPEEPLYNKGSLTLSSRAESEVPSNYVHEQQVALFEAKLESTSQLRTRILHRVPLALANHFNSTAIVEAGLTIFETLLLHDPIPTGANARIMQKVIAGDYEKFLQHPDLTGLVAQALTQHGSNRRILHKVLRLLLSIVQIVQRGDEVKNREMVARQFQQTNFLPALVELLAKQTGEDAQLQLPCCKLIRCFAPVLEGKILARAFSLADDYISSSLNLKYLLKRRGKEDVLDLLLANLQIMTAVLNAGKLQPHFDFARILKNLLGVVGQTAMVCPLVALWALAVVKALPKEGIFSAVTDVSEFETTLCEQVNGIFSSVVKQPQIKSLIPLGLLPVVEVEPEKNYSDIEFVGTAAGPSDDGLENMEIDLKILQELCIMLQQLCSANKTFSMAINNCAAVHDYLACISNLSDDGYETTPAIGALRETAQDTITIVQTLRGELQKAERRYQRSTSAAKPRGSGHTLMKKLSI